MENIDTESLIYLVVLGLLVAGWFFVQARGSLGKSLQHIAIWVFIFFGAIAAYGLWDDVSHTVAPRQTVFAEQGEIVVPRSPDGHYHLMIEVNGQPLRFVLDTGATNLVLTQDDARRAGIDLDNLHYVGRAATANGEVRTAPVRLDQVSLGGIVDHGVRAVVNGGDMHQSLLGMDYLQRWGGIQIANNTLTLTR